MPRWNYKPKTKRRLPHWQFPDATLFVTFRLAGSIAKPYLRKYKAAKDFLEAELKHWQPKAESGDETALAVIEQRQLEFRRQWFVEFEDLLHREAHGPTWLKEESVAQQVADSLHYRDGKIFRLDAFCIMSNHVHTVFAPFFSEAEWLDYEEAHAAFNSDVVLSNLMQSLKGYTAWQCNQLLGRKGQFWEHESYDHIVRNADAQARIVRYVLNNPVKAGLVEQWQDWRWHYVRSDLVMDGDDLVPQPV
jgi:REP element-mobilizing transposase RayT